MRQHAKYSLKKYHLRGFPLKSVNDFRDLGVQRLSNEGYASHIASTTYIPTYIPTFYIYYYFICTRALV